MATLHITEADRDERGRIKLAPRNLADLLPQPDAIRQDAARIVRKPATKHEFAAGAAIALLLVFLLVWTWQTPQAVKPASALPLPTAYIAPARAPAPQPTMTPAPTAMPLPAAAPVVQDAPDTASVMDAPQAQQDTAPAIVPEDLVILNDPAQNGNSLAPPGCPFPIINGICGNGALAKDVPDVPARDGTRSTK